MGPQSDSSVSFTFPGPAKRMSSNDRMFWAAKAGLTSLWRQTAHMYARRNKHRFTVPPVPSNVLITFEVSDPGRRRDPMNAYPTIKAIIDGITDAGIWPDDNSRWVTVIEPRFVKGRPGYVQVDISPRDAA
jgi:crossover junction endodeoxyribonuclease RusA